MGLLTLKLRQIQQRQSERLYTRISAAQVRRQLIEQKGYRDEDLPTAEVIRQQLNQMGDRQLRVAKTKPHAWRKPNPKRRLPRPRRFLPK